MQICSTQLLHRLEDLKDKPKNWRGLKQILADIETVEKYEEVCIRRFPERFKNE